MTVVAKLKALLHLDSSKYRDGAKDAAGQTVTLRREIAQTNDQLRKTATLSSGLSAILQGNLVRGIKMVITSLTGMNSQLSTMIGKLGLIGATAAASFKIGSWIADKTGIGKKTEEYLNEPVTKEELARRRQRGAKAAQAIAERRSEKEAGKVTEDTEDLRVKRLKGMAKIEAEYARDRKDIIESMNKAVSLQEKTAWHERLVQRVKFYNDDVAAFRRAEEKKVKEQHEKVMEIATSWKEARAEATAEFDERKQDFLERTQERASSVQGRGIQVDAMAKMGGKIGAQRPGIAIADRQFRVAEVMTEAAKDWKKVAQEFDKTVAKMDRAVEKSLEKARTEYNEKTGE